MRKKRKKEKSELVLRQQIVLGRNEDKEVFAAAAYAVHGLLLFVWTVGCLKWIDEVLTLHMALAPLCFAVVFFCLLFEAAMRLNCMWKASGAAVLIVLADIWINHRVLLEGLNMIACQVVRAISEYYHLESDIENVVINTDILLHDFVLLSVFIVMIVGTATVKWRTGMVPGMLFVMLLTASLMVDSFPHVSTLVMLLTSTAGLIAVLPVETSAGNRKKGGFKNGRGYIRTGLYAVGMILVISGISYGAAKAYVAEKMHSYYDSIKEYPQQMITGMQEFISGKDGEISQMEQWMSSIAAGLDAGDGQLTNAAPIQTRAVVLSVDVTVKPETALYFKSYTGGNYDADKEQWQILNDASFQNAYAGWNSASELSYDEAKSTLATRLYDCLDEAALTESCSYHVQNVSGNKAYTWAPYGVDLGGITVRADGILSGSSQTLFAGYSMLDTEELLDTLPYYIDSTYNQALLAEYTDYVYQTYLEVPEKMQALREGYESLARIYQGASDLEWIEAIQTELETTCTYERYGLAAVPAGSNIIDDFYGSQKEGYCIHFASAGVMLLRMAGIPARYVTGYVAWPDDFHYDGESECYHADITGYRGHAWVEVYDAELGAWLPVEMTTADSVQNLGPENAQNNNGRMTETEEKRTEDQQTEETAETSERAESRTESNETMESELEPSTSSDDSRGNVSSVPQSSGDQTGNNSPQDKSSESKNGWTLPLALAAIAVILLGIYVYNSRNNSGIRRFSKVNRNKGVLSMEWHLTEIMDMAGWMPEKNMDDWSYAQWLREKVETLEDGECLFFMEKLHQAAYSEEMISEEDYQKCFAIYQKIYSKIVSEMKGLKKLWFSLYKHT